MSSPWIRYATGAVIAGFLIGVGLYLGDHSHPALAGIFATIPVALPAIFLMNNSQVRDYSHALIISIFSYFIATLLFFHLSNNKNIPFNKSLTISMVTWLILVSTMYFLFTDGPYSLNSL